MMHYPDLPSFIKVIKYVKPPLYSPYYITSANNAQPRETFNGRIKSSKAIAPHTVAHDDDNLRCTFSQKPRCT